MEKNELEKFVDDSRLQHDMEKEQFHKLFKENMEEIKKLKNLLVSNERLLAAAVEREKLFREKNLMSADRTNETSKALSTIIKRKNMAVI